MKVKLFGDPSELSDLEQKVKNSLEELGLVDFIELEITNDQALKEELKITKAPALILEEETIDFKDVIFEGIIPEEEEIKSMFVSIVGGNGGDCSSEGGCGSCSSGCG